MSASDDHMPTTPSTTKPWYTLLGWGLALLLLTLPFELTHGIPLPGLIVTNVELLMLFVLGVWVGVMLWERRSPLAPAWLVLPVALFLAALMLSAALAEHHRGDAIKFVARQIQGGLVALCVAERVAVEGWRLLQRLLMSLVAGGTISALLGLWELTEAPVALAVLSPFKGQLSLMGGFLRLSATLSYANIAAMYFEALLPLAIVGTIGLLRGRLRLLGLAVAVVLYLATLLTYSRAALMTSTALLIAVPLFAALNRRQPALLWQSLGLSASLVVAALVLVALSPTFRLRLLNPDESTWYSAAYRPGPIGSMAPKELRRVPITVTNLGLAGWPRRELHPFRLSYHWLDATTGDYVHFEGRRTELPSSVEPGGSVDLRALVQAPNKPGNYLLAWDLVRENTGGGWFSQIGSPSATVPVHVAGPPAQGQRVEDDARVPAGLREFVPGAPARSELWKAAIILWRERPMVGIGPDVFRHVYGPLLGLKQWDDRIHTNNLYLEILTGAGLLGFTALCLLLGLVLYQGFQILLPASSWRPDLPGASASARGEPDALRRWFVLAGLLGLASFLVHGLLDVFLAFTPTYLLFWIWIGVVGGLSFQKAALRRWISTPAVASRSRGEAAHHS